MSESDSPVNQVVSQNLKLLRLMEGKNKSELSREIGITSASITNYEYDAKNLNIMKALRFTDYYHIELNDLINPNLIHIGSKND